MLNTAATKDVQVLATPHYYDAMTVIYWGKCIAAEDT